MANLKAVDVDKLDADLASVANAIRAKGETSGSLAFPNGFVDAVNNIEATEVVEPVITPITIKENGEYVAPDGVDGHSPIKVEVPIPAPVEPIIEALTITENGTYTAPEGIDGYSPITVEVEGEGGSFIDPSWTNFSSLFAQGRATDEVVSKLKFSDTSNGTGFTQMFQSGTMTTIPKLDTSNGTSFAGMFSNCSNLTTVPTLDTSKGTNLSSMFDDCRKLTAIPEINTSNNTSFSNIFAYCMAITTIPTIDTSSGTNFFQMFYYCMKLTSIPPLDTSNGTSFSGMFGHCDTLTTAPQLNTSNGTNFADMFSDCSNLTTVPTLDTSTGTNFSGMFKRCKKLETIEGIDISKGTTLGSMFSNCNALKNITFNGEIIRSIDFSGCYYLTIDSLKSIITALKDYAGTTNEGKYTLTLYSSRKTLLENDTSTTENGLTWLAFAESKGWNIA